MKDEKDKRNIKRLIMLEILKEKKIWVWVLIFNIINLVSIAQHPSLNFLFSVGKGKYCYRDSIFDLNLINDFSLQSKTFKIFFKQNIMRLNFSNIRQNRKYSFDIFNSSSFQFKNDRDSVLRTIKVVGLAGVTTDVGLIDEIFYGLSGSNEKTGILFTPDQTESLNKFSFDFNINDNNQLVVNRVIIGIRTKGGYDKAIIYNYDNNGN